VESCCEFGTGRRLPLCFRALNGDSTVFASYKTQDIQHKNNLKHFSSLPFVCTV
jgi:hypothetical protein